MFSLSNKNLKSIRIQKSSLWYFYKVTTITHIVEFDTLKTNLGENVRKELYSLSGFTVNCVHSFKV